MRGDSSTDTLIAEHSVTVCVRETDITRHDRDPNSPITLMSKRTRGRRKLITVLHVDKRGYQASSFMSVISLKHAHTHKRSNSEREFSKLEQF